MATATDQQRITKLEARSFSLDDLVAEVRRGKVRLPEFQRRFRWTASDVERLFESIYRGYPIGTVLFWKRGAPAGQVLLGGASWVVPALDEAYWVIDGQQRLTSLALSAFLDIEVADRRFNVFFDPATEKFLTLPPGTAPADSILPLRKAFDLALVLEWTATVGAGNVARDRAFELTKRLRDFQVPAYIIETDDESATREIFDRMNTFGRRMKRSEVFDALHSSMGERQPHDLAWVGEVSQVSGFGDLDEQQLLYSVLATRGTDVFRDFHSEFAGLPEAARREVYEQARVALGLAIDFLRSDAHVLHARLVPYQHLLVALVRFFSLYPSPTPRSRVLLRRWFWRGAALGPHLKGGYTGTLRHMVRAVTESGETKTVQVMLSTVVAPPEKRVFVPTDQVRLSTADSRITLAALTALAPVSPLSGEPVAPDEVWGTDHEPLPTIFDPMAYPGVTSRMGNRLLIASTEADEISALEAILRTAERGDMTLLAAHLINEEFVRAAQSDRAVDAVTARAALIKDYVSQFVNGRAEWDLPDRPSIEELLSDDR